MKDGYDILIIIILIILFICLGIEDKQIEKQVARANKAEWIIECIDATKFNKDQCSSLYMSDFKFKKEK
jgi:hypothetical protein